MPKITAVEPSSELTEAQAIAFFEGGKWKSMTLQERALFQINQRRLCMPFDKFHEAVEKTVGRPVYTHEFGLNVAGIRAELEGRGQAPNIEEIIAMLPADKVIVVEGSK